MTVPDFVITRRKLLALLGLSPLITRSALASSALAQTARVSGNMFPIIDVHCHVFNAADLPVRGFLQRVIFGDEEDQVIFDPDAAKSRAIVPWLGAVLLELMLQAPDAASELAALRQRPRTARAALEEIPLDVRVERLRKALEATFAPKSEPPANLQRMVPRSGLEGGRELFRQKILEETGLGLEPRILRPDEKPFEPLARGLLSGRGVFSRHIQWADLLTGYRSVIVQRLAALYQDVTLFVPALIDFSAWLEDEPRSSLEQQIEVMERIQRLDLGPPIHCMAPFDPWRQVLDEEAGRHPSAMELVKTAVMEKGFLGVKLYPPMGFLPIGNEGSRLSYPARARSTLQFPRRIDQALERLYGWAEQNGVPIMAHATNSNGAVNGYALRAHPKHWSQVLKRFPGLQLNLAHFGGFDETKIPGDLDDTWEQAVAELIKEGRKGLYADTSYLHEFLPGIGKPERLELIRQNFQVFKRQFDPDLRRLMYGSDWSMLARENNYEQYLAVIRTLIGDIGTSDVERRRFFGGNAVRFLGLQQGGAARTRLEAYYQRNNLDPEWLTKLDEGP